MNLLRAKKYLYQIREEKKEIDELRERIMSVEASMRGYPAENWRRDEMSDERNLWVSPLNVNDWFNWDEE